MNDPHLVGPEADAHALREQANIARAELLCAEIPERDRVTIVLGKELLDGGDGAVIEAETLAALPLRIAGILADLGRWHESEDHDAANAAWLLVVEGMARAAASRPPGQQDIVTAGKVVLRGVGWALQELDRRFIALLGAMDADLREAWIQALSREPAFEGPAATFESDLVSHVDGHHTLPTVEHPFAHRKYRGQHFDLDSFGPIRIVGKIDPARRLRVLDRWQNRWVISSTLGTTVKYDGASILELLRSAEPIIDADHQWTGRTAAPALVPLVLDYCVLWSNRGVGPASEQQLLDFCGAAWNILLDRLDGPLIATWYLAELTERSWMPAKSQPHEEVAVGAAREALLNAMAVHGLGVNDLRHWWREKCRLTGAVLVDPREDAKRLAGGQVDPAESQLAAWQSAVDLAASANADASEALWDWLHHRLVHRDVHWSRASYNQAYACLLAGAERVLIAEVVAGALVERAMTRWQDTYSALEPQRRRGEFGRHRLDASCYHTTFFMLQLGVLALGRLSETVDQVDLERLGGSWLWTMIQSAWRIHLVGSFPWPEAPTSNEVVVDVISKIPRVFKTDPITELAKALDLVTDGAAIAAHVSAELLVSGVERSIIEAAWERQGLSLEQVLQRAEEWAAATAAPYEVAAADELRKALLPQPSAAEPTS